MGQREYITWLQHKITKVHAHREETLTLVGIRVIKMPIRPNLGIMSIGHNINDARLLTPLVVGTMVTRVTKVTMGT